MRSNKKERGKSKNKRKNGNKERKKKRKEKTESWFGKHAPIGYFPLSLLKFYPLF